MLSKIGIGFISNFLLKARVLVYLNTKFFIFNNNNGRSGEKKFLAKRFAHVISVHYRDF